MKFLVLAASIATSVAAGGIEQSTLKSYVSSNHERFLTDLREHSNRILSPDTQVKPTIRRLAGAGEGSYFCDIQFMECLGHPKCTSCFSELQDADIDWSIIAPSNSKCDVVINALMDKVGICKSLQLDDKEKETFCKTFDSCVIWKSGDDSDHTDPSSGNDDSDKNHIDCSELTKCEWDGMKPSYIGDGVCHEFIDGCYNTAICGYDGGDCCPETCKNSTEFVGCGSDGYFCRNTTSPNCEEKVCGKNKDGKDKPDTPAKPIPDCGENKAPYKLFLYDSFGDGWDRTEMKVTDRDDNTHSAIFDGRLEDGSEGLEYLCLSKTTACYQVNLSGGFWGNEVSWQIKPMRKGAPDIASGGAPMDCEFAVGGAQHCENTCTGRSNVDPEEDEKYHTYHKMADCIERECILQLAMCEDDVVCTSCLNSASTPAYCMADDIFNALAFCTECKCVEGINESEKEMFCKDKSRDKHESEQTDDDSINPTIPDDSSSKRVRACSYDEFTKGSAAVINYSECSGIETFAALLTDFDPDNFGMLDSFETCASEYKKGGYGKNALDCMRILEDAIMNPTKGMDQSKIDKGVPKEAISALAEDLLTNGEQFCECSSDASEGLAPCKDFIHFKTLLYESIDACKGLDAIDCDAWAEFYKPCRSNMEDKFKNIDFKKSKQCEYIKNGCGNVGPFPSFRRLDCDREITKEAWDFYLDYDDKCNTKAVPKSKPKPSKPPPTPAPPTPSSHGGISTSMPTKASDRKYDPSHTSPTSSGNKKYVPPEKRNSGSGGFISKIVNFFVWIFKITLFCCLAAGAYWLYKNKFADFDYSRFRRARNYGADNNGMYDSLTMENAGASFQPPTLPPPPSSYDNSGGNNGMYNMNVGGFA